jgi:trimethylamine--corrinoid protein Co-methyltransferase
MRIVDIDTWETRTPTVKENNDACKIADGLEHVHASTSYTPYYEMEGVEPDMLMIYSTWSRLKYFSKISRIGASPDSHIWEIQMAQALDVDVYAAMEAAPPLTFTKEGVENGMACAKEGYPVEVGCGGVLGMTHPVTTAGALACSIAEVMGGIVIVQLTSSGVPVIVNSFDIPANMKTGSPAFGAMGISLFQVAWNQFWRTRYNIPIMNGGIGPSISKTIDFQCGYEKAMGIVFSAISGAHIINTVGGLSGELSYHPVLSVLDNDMAGRIGRMLEGVTVSTETLALDLINLTGPIPGSYLETDHTFQWWRKEPYLPLCADMTDYPQWLNLGKRTALDMAREQADQLLDNYKKNINGEQEQELDRILEEAKRYYRKKR